MDLYDRKKSTLLLLPLVFILLTGFIFAQNTQQELIKNYKWRNIGPANMVGRISDFEALDNDFTHVLVASASGGVWKSVNAGTTWEPIFDEYGSASIGDIALCQQNPDIIWVGTGEECCRNSIAWGDGIYKSTDGGKTFTHMGLKSTHTIGRVLIHPDNPDIVFAAATGHTWGYSGDRGLFKTEDGGETWTKLTNGLPDDKKTGAIDMVMHPENPDILYVSFWQRLRRPWRFDSGGPNSGIFKSMDGGETWTELTGGLPEGEKGRIGLAISRSNPKVLMAVVEHGYQPRPMIRENGEQKPNPEYEDMTKLGTGIYRSENGGATWQYMNRINVRPFYYSHIYINPFDDTLVYYLSTSMQYSEDGGKTFKTIEGLHPDFHAMWLDPTDKNRFYVGQDGGASITYDHGKTWVFYDNLCVSQFYAVSADMRDPYYVYGGLQDNGTWAGPSRTRADAILTDHWFNLGGGDGFYTQNDPAEWRIAYGESQGGNIFRIDVETRDSTRIRPTRENTYNWDEFVPKTKDQEEDTQMPFRRRSPFRFNWSTPILLSPHNTKTLFFGGNHLFKSIDRGDHWTIISPDLTTNDPEKYDKPTGGLTLDQTGAETHCTITSIAQSPIRPDIIWAGTDDGQVQVTKDGGKTWTNVRKNIPDVPAEIWVSRVEASSYDEGSCFVSFDGHRSDVFTPYIFKTDDFGQSWTNISGNIPEDEPVYVIRQDLKNENLLFAGTEFSAYFSLDQGNTWTDLRLNMPTVAFHDLVIHPRDNDLIAGTHGRGIWILDDISPLQEFTENVKSQDLYLFENEQPGTKWVSLRRGGYGRGNLYFQGENPKTGAAVHFYLKEQPENPVEIEISDAAGKHKTTYTLDDLSSGINRLMWDMHFDPPEDQMKQTLSRMKNLMDRILQRPEVEEKQKEVVQKALEKLEQPGLTFRQASAIQRQAFEEIGFGRYMRYFGAGRGAVEAEPGTYAVKITAGGKTVVGEIDVREDPAF